MATYYTTEWSWKLYQTIMYYATINITLYLNNIYSFESYKNIVNGWYYITSARATEY